MRAPGGRCERQEAGAGTPSPFLSRSAGEEGGRGEGEGEIGQRRAVTPPYQNWLACMSDVHPDRRDGQCAANLRHFLCSTG